MQIILFDIDGTLITTRGAGQDAMRHVARTATGAQPDDSRMNFAGRTDRSIISDHFTAYGIEDNAENFDAFCATFLRRLPTQLQESSGTILPGVLETLDRLQRDPNIKLGLLTGNLREAAHIKLDHFGLRERFLHEGDFVGGFGDDHHDRDDVARAALAELRERFSPAIAPQHIWIIGDTPNDVKCARAVGARVLAVATGQYSFDELEKTTPDIVVESLQSADQWWNRVAC